jgi:kynureninase
MDPLRREALELDAVDPLRRFRSEFELPGEAVYLDGNSLGLVPHRTKERVQRLVEDEWGGLAIGGWNAGWMDLPLRLGSKVARVVGALEDEVVVADSTSVNFYRLTLAAMRDSTRNVIVTDDCSFPSNIYILQGCVPASQIRVVASQNGVTAPEDIEKALDDSVALLSLNHVSFKSGQLHEMERLTNAAHKVGAKVLWDLSHSVGVVPMQLRNWGVDLAVGCTYKYLNGGPGAPAFMYVRKELLTRLSNPIQGWIGQQNPFEFQLGYEAATGIRRFLTGTPHILSMAAIEPGVDLILEAGMEKIREKSERLTDFMIRLWREMLEPIGFTLNTPLDKSIRGSHVSLGHEHAYGIDRALIERMGVIPDFRRPDNIRFGFAPLYNGFEDAWKAADRMAAVVASRSYEGYQPEGLVT